MAQIQVIIDDVNPLIQYGSTSPPWVAGGFPDPFSQNYYYSTYTINNQTGSNVSFTFNGTGIVIYGSKRPTHGQYSANVDGAIVTNIDGFDATGIYQQPIFTELGLGNTQHTVVLTINGPGAGNQSFLDIDYIKYYIEVDPSLSLSTDQDDDVAFNYVGNWSQTPEYLGSYNGANGHTTSTPGDSVTYTFQVSSAVQIYGTVGPNNGGYTIQLDGGRPLSFNASNPYPYMQVMLYEANNLGEGTHSVKLTNQPAIFGKRLNIDYATVRGQAPPQSNGSSLSGGAIAGIAVGACVMVILILANLYFVSRLRSNRRILDPKPAYQMDPFPLPVATNHTTTGSFSSPQSLIPQLTSEQLLDQGTGQSSQEASTRRRNLDQDTSQVIQESLLPSRDSSPVLNSVITKRRIPGPRPLRPQVRRDPSFPPSRTTQDVIREERSQVEDRPQNYGPISPGPSQLSDSPPDYNEATGPLQPLR